MVTCEACGHELESRTCKKCQGHNPKDARFCCYCGEPMPAPSIEGGEIGEDPYDVKNRILCSDENCIGIINEHGVCTECGRPYEKKD